MTPSGPNLLRRVADENAGLGAEHEERREEPARRAGRVARERQREAGEEDGGGAGGVERSPKGLLDQAVARPEQARREEPHGSDRRADDQGNRVGVPARSQSVEQPERDEQETVEERADRSGRHPEEQQRQESRDSRALDHDGAELRRAAEEAPIDLVGRHTGEQGRERVPRRPEHLHLLEHEERSRERRVERGGETRSRSGGEERPAALAGCRQRAAEGAAERRAHEHRRALRARASARRRSRARRP